MSQDDVDDRIRPFVRQNIDSLNFFLFCIVCLAGKPKVGGNM